MCLIIVKKPNVHLTKKIIKGGFQYNNDGAGLMFATNNKLIVHKGFFSFRKFYKQFREYERKYPNSTFVLHFRLATSSTINTKFCHPFMVNKNVAFVHNGILSGLQTSITSDTYEFNKQYLQRLPADFIDNSEIMKIISDYCKKSLSKMVFMDNKGKYIICNEEAGYWSSDNKIWFSNDSYKYNKMITTVSHNVGEWCEICGIYSYTKLRKLNGCYCCDYCYNELKGYNSLVYPCKKECRFCREKKLEWEGITNKIGQFYCKECIEVYKYITTIECPFCYNVIVVDNDICPVCECEINDYTLVNAFSKVLPTLTED